LIFSQVKQSSLAFLLGFLFVRQPKKSAEGPVESGILFLTHHVSRMVRRRGFAESITVDPESCKNNNAKRGDIMTNKLNKTARALAISFALLSAANSGAAEPTTRLVSVNNAGTGSGIGGDSVSPKFSSNGRFIVFYSFASDLVANDTNGTSDVFVRDLKTGTTTLVSINKDGTDSGNGTFSYNGTLNANGRFVAFISNSSDLVANDTNGTYDVFVRDLKTGTTALASINSEGTDSGNDLSTSSLNSPPAMSADGRFVAFESYASDLVANDTNNTIDVFVRDLKTGTTALVSVNYSGTASSRAGSTYPVISADGRFVAFQSNSVDLVTNDTGNISGDVFIRDLKAGTTSLVSVNKTGTASGNDGAKSPSISANGRFVAFTSNASDLVENDNNIFYDVFVRDLKTGTTTLASINRAGTAGGNSGASENAPVLSPNGRFVAFTSYSSNLVANVDDNNAEDVFVRDLKTGTTLLASVNRAGRTGNGGLLTLSLSIPALNANGRFVAFTSSSSDLVANDTNGTYDVFVRDFKTGITRLASINNAGTNSGNDLSYQAVLSPDGRFIAFTSNANNLVENDTNDANDIFIRPTR
jgi:hypothetical protein